MDLSALKVSFESCLQHKGFLSEPHDVMGVHDSFV